MKKINQYDLTRSIPLPIKREVRQRYGFGCVFCGCALIHYHHVDPLYCDAKEHDPDCIVLLCGTHHDQASRGRLSKETVKAKSENPKCKEQGFSFDSFDIGINEPIITIGTLRFVNIRTLICINGDEIFSINTPKSKGMPFEVNAFLCDKNGNEILHIVDNEWRSSSQNWDVEITGKKLIIRKKQGDILLAIRTDPPNLLTIERLDMKHKGTRIVGSEGKKLNIITSSLSKIHAENCDLEVNGCPVGINVVKDKINIGVGGKFLTIGKKDLPGMVHIDGCNIDHLHVIGSGQSSSKKTSRNMLCPCESNKRYKHCCGAPI